MMDAMGRTGSDLYSDCAQDRSEDFSSFNRCKSAAVLVASDTEEPHQSSYRDRKRIEDWVIQTTRPMGQLAISGDSINQTTESQSERPVEYESNTLQGQPVWQSSSSESLVSFPSCSTTSSLENPRMITPNSWDNLYFDNEGEPEVKSEWQKVAISLDEADKSKDSELEMYRISRNFFKLLAAPEQHSVSLCKSVLRNSLIRNMNEFISPRRYQDLHHCIINIQLMCAFYKENQQAFKQLSLGEPTARITRSDSPREALVSVTALRDALSKSAMPHQPESKQYSSTNIRWYEKNTEQRLVLDESSKPWEPG